MSAKSQFLQDPIVQAMLDANTKNVGEEKKVEEKNLRANSPQEKKVVRKRETKRDKIINGITNDLFTLVQRLYEENNVPESEDLEREVKSIVEKYVKTTRKTAPKADLPVKPRSAYILYAIEARKQITERSEGCNEDGKGCNEDGKGCNEDGKGSFGGLKGSAITKKIGRDWRDMDEKEKEVYQRKAEEDKARYERELKACSEEQRQQIVNKSLRDPDAPKRPKSAQILFYQARKAGLEMRGYKGKEMREVMKEEWKEMMDDEKKEYIDAHNKEKERYELEMKNYVRPSTEELRRRIEEEQKRKKVPSKPPSTPLEAYRMFSRAVKKEWKSNNENTGLSNDEKNDEIRRMWEEEGVREPYEEKYNEKMKQYEEKLALYREFHPEGRRPGGLEDGQADEEKNEEGDEGEVEEKKGEKRGKKSEKGGRKKSKINRVNKLEKGEREEREEGKNYDGPIIEEEEEDERGEEEEEEELKYRNDREKDNFNVYINRIGMRKIRRRYPGMCDGKTLTTKLFNHYLRKFRARNAQKRED